MKTVASILCTMLWIGFFGQLVEATVYYSNGSEASDVSPLLHNISTRAFVQTGDNVVIGGFIIQGRQPKRVIVRAIGPELTQYGVPNALANPTLELHDSTGALIASNDNWVSTIIGGIITSDQVSEIRDSGYAPGDGRESAIIAELPPGNYTAIVRGVNDMTGVALVELYDLSTDANSILGNISTRAFVQTDDNVMIGGFIVQGRQPKRVIVRAIGPQLGAPPYDIPNPLYNPTLELHDGAGALIASNDNWTRTIIGGIITTNQVREIIDSGLVPGDGRESAIIADLPAGNYTAIVRGVNNTTGVALVEVYGLDQQVAGNNPSSGATYHSDGSEAAIGDCTTARSSPSGGVQWLHDNCASDGDTITLPSGTFSWTARANITKNITIQGNTTISGAGTSSCSANDQTIIQDNVTPRSKQILSAVLTPNSSLFRLTGITFAPGTTTTFGGTDGAFIIRSSNTSYLYNVRIDNCHFAQLYQNRIFQPRGYVYGVFDHNFVQLRGNAFAFKPENGGDVHGNAAWGDYPWYGTNKFFFFETNTVIRSGTTGMNALSDGYLGGRYVVRHNFLQNVSVQGHGTEGAGTARGQRAVEVYDNIISVIPPYLNTAHGTRSGGALVHDNRFQDLNLVNPPNIFVLANYRETSQRAYTQLGISDGTSIWDANDTDGNGHYVAGNPPHLFASGTVTSPEPTPVLGLGTITDSSKAWTTNRWAGAPWSGPTGIYSIKSTTPTTTSHSLGAYCTANTGTTVTYSYYPASDAGNNPNSGLPAHLLFNVGDQYEIHRVLIEMDQCGRGKADLLYEGTTATAGAQTIPESTITVQGGGTNAFPANPGEIYVGPYRFNCTGKTSNTFTGCTTGWTSGTIAAGTPVAGTYISGTNQQTFPNSALEPCYSWNNVYNASPTPSPAPGVTPSGTQWGMYTTTPATEVLGTDFFNLGARGWDTTPPSVSSTYVAALNGVAYIGTYVYPHPLTSP